MDIRTLETNTKTEFHKLLPEDGSHSNSCFSPQHTLDSEEVIARYAKYYNLIFDGFHVLYGEPIYSWQDFLRFMKDVIGFEITIVHFENPMDSMIAGTWKWDDVEKKSFIILLNSATRDANITIGHECVHAIQDIDEDFKQEVENYPLPLRMRIADRVAEMVAIQIFRPREKVVMDRAAGLSVYEIALKYGVSESIASFS